MGNPKTTQLSNQLTAYHMVGTPQTESFKNSRLRQKLSTFYIFTVGLKGGAISKGGTTSETRKPGAEGFLLEPGSPVSINREKIAVGRFDFVITVDEMKVAY